MCKHNESKSKSILNFEYLIIIYSNAKKFKFKLIDVLYYILVHRYILPNSNLQLYLYQSFHSLKIV